MNADSHKSSNHLPQRAELLVNEDLARLRNHVIQATGSTVNWDTVAFDPMTYALLGVQTKQTSLRMDDSFLLSIPIGRLSGGGREPGIYAFVIFDRDEHQVAKLIFHEHELHRLFYPQLYGLPPKVIGLSRGKKKGSLWRVLKLCRNAVGELVSKDFAPADYLNDVGWKRALKMIHEGRKLREYNYYHLIAKQAQALAA